MTVTRKMTWFTGSLILLALATAAAESFAGGGPDCPHSNKQTITGTQPQMTPAPKQEKAAPAKAAPSEQKKQDEQPKKVASTAPA
jgi:hypothetical protein